MVLHLIRILFLVVVIAITVSFASQQEVVAKGPGYTTAYILLPVALAFVMVMVDIFWRRKHLQALSGLFFGVLAGLAIAYVLSLIINLVVSLFPAPPSIAHPGPKPERDQFLVDKLTGQPKEGVAKDQALTRYAESLGQHDVQLRGYMTHTAYIQRIQLIKLLIGGAAVFMCVSFVMQTKDDFRFVVPYVEFSRQTKGARPFLLDTSVIIDGRIADIMETQILESEVIVPRFILAELQTIADSEDRLKRNRGRRGLDILNRLQTAEKVDIRIMEATPPNVQDATQVDAKLVALAEHLDARVVTNDYNLNKIAQLRGVQVVNINDLANALKPVVLPGESMRVKVIKPGEEPGQGVGYLEDGTMVVAEHGRDYIGREIAITVTSVLQTSAGRMIFGRLDADRTFGRQKGSSATASQGDDESEGPATS